MRKITYKKANAIYKSMIIRHCYPYCVILDDEKKLVAFRNRNYLFLQDYPTNNGLCWFQLESKNYEILHSYLVSTKGIHFQKYGNRFLEYYLYHDGNPPMRKVSDYNRYRNIIKEIISIMANDNIKRLLTPEEHGFDFGKQYDGEYFKRNENDELVNVFNAARLEADYRICRMSGIYVGGLSLESLKK